MQHILIGVAIILASGNYWGHPYTSWLYNLHPALSGAIGILTFMLRPANNVLVTHDLTAHKLLAALSIQLRGGRPPPVEGPPKKVEKEILRHEDEDLDAYKY